MTIALFTAVWTGWQLNNTVRAFQESQENLQRIKTEEKRKAFETLYHKSPDLQK